MLITRPQMAALLVSHGRAGFYFRVLEEDEIGASDDAWREVRPSPSLTEPGARRQ